MKPEPEIGHGAWVYFKNSEGEVAFLPRHLFGKDTSCRALRKFTGIENIVKTRVVYGYGARVTGPGYTDQSDWFVFKTKIEAESFLEETLDRYGFNDEDEDDEFEEEDDMSNSHRLPEDHFAVFCKDDGRYCLATRGLFATRESAEEYVVGINDSRDAVIIPTEHISRLVDGWYQKD